MSKYRIIAIERQYASGGRAVGKQAAAQLGVPCYGREILEMAAERNGQTAEYIEHLEETASGTIPRKRQAFCAAMTSAARTSIMSITTSSGVTRRAITSAWTAASWA